MRKSIEYIQEEGTDKGKVFVITRMSAFKADEWAMDIVRGLSKAGAKLPIEAKDMGIATLGGLAMTLFGVMDKDISNKALAELLECCQIKRDPKNPNVQPAKILEGDITDPMTLKELRVRAFQLHVDFILAAASLISPLAVALQMGKNENSQDQ
ncbi:hypothetical protein FAI40_10050 [Acetobacteraceae bacterium]|nr:hypothetical protein FAI40_10050 [Acetobacteraceae bacterium]